MKDYKELDVWQSARKLVVAVYQLTAGFPKEEVYGLTSQIRRCAVSIPSNIAEGVGRNYPKETIHFLHVSRGSIYELETQMIIAKDLGLLDEEKHNTLDELLKKTRMLLNGFISYYDNLQNTQNPGQRVTGNR